MAIAKIERTKSIKEQVFSQLKQQLIDGEWKPGQKLPSEDALSEIFGVSKVTVRQAMQQLSTLGLVETRLGDGSYVKEPSFANLSNQLVPLAYLGSDLKEVMQFRRAVETETAAIAASVATDEDIAYLRSTMERILKAAPGDADERINADLDFHYHIALMTKNPLIIRSYDIVLDVLHDSLMEIVEQFGSRAAIAHHPLIIDAIAAHDEENAARYMRIHLSASMNLGLYGAAEGLETPEQE